MCRLPSLAVLLAFAALAAPSAAGAAECPGADVRPAADTIAQVAQTTLCLINGERAAAGLGALTEQGQLTAASTAFSTLMVSDHFFDHVSPDGSELTDRLTKAGYLGGPGSWIVGENIAWGESYLASPANIVKAWMDSPPHRANILKADYEEIGLGIVVGTPSTPNPGATYTTDFGRRRGEDPPASEAKGEITVGDTAQPSSQAPRGNAKRSTEASRRVASRKAAHRRARSTCRRSKGRSRAARRAFRRSRCVGAWRAVHVRL